VSQLSHSSQVVRIILLVSCAHALVHLLEQSIASVELVISLDFQLDMQQSGLLGFALRLPYGVGALFAGLLADRFGEKRILVLYLAGAALTCASFSAADDANVVYAQLFALGSFASMYHPAGLALLANQTTLAERSRALGTHGIFGSLGIALAPFLAGLVLSVREADWKFYYLLLGLLAGTLAVLIWLLLKPESAAKPAQHSGSSQTPPAATTFQLWPYGLLVTGAGLAGIVYGGVLHFLPRYLLESGTLSFVTDESSHSAGNYCAAMALICGALGQWLAGRIARPSILPVQLSLVYAANIPFLIWMTFATGPARLVAACLWAFVHFMNQPLYNSLVPEFMPRHRRSLGFGFSNMMGFGVGAVGPYFVGRFDERFQNYTLAYSGLAVIALLAALMPLPLLASRVAKREEGESNK
jgi:MFS family permease